MGESSVYFEIFLFEGDRCAFGRLFACRSGEVDLFFQKGKIFPMERIIGRVRRKHSFKKNVRSPLKDYSTSSTSLCDARKSLGLLRRKLDREEEPRKTSGKGV